MSLIEEEDNDPEMDIIQFVKVVDVIKIIIKEGPESGNIFKTKV